MSGFDPHEVANQLRQIADETGDQWLRDRATLLELPKSEAERSEVQREAIDLLCRRLARNGALANALANGVSQHGSAPGKIETSRRREVLDWDATLVKVSEATEVHLAMLSSIAREQVRWLWPERVPLGMLTLLIGDPGLGKSLLGLMLAALVSRAGGDVLILSAEDHAGATIRPRAEALEADLDRLHIVGMRRHGLEDGLALPDDAAELDRAAKETGARLVIVDPLVAHLPGSVNSWHDQSMRTALAPLHRISQDRGLTMFLIAHLNKSRGDDPIYRAGGSIGLPAAVRSCLLLARDPSDPQEERGSRRVLAHIKCNVAPQAESLSCQVDPVLLPGAEQLETARITITGTSATSASELLASVSGEERSDRDEAVEFLMAELAQKPKWAKDISKAARDAEIGPGSLKRAKRILASGPKRQGSMRAGSGRYPKGTARRGRPL